MVGNGSPVQRTVPHTSLLGPKNSVPHTAVLESINKVCDTVWRARQGSNLRPLV